MGSGEDPLSPGDEMNEHTIVGLSGRDSPSAEQWSDSHTLSPLILSAILVPISQVRTSRLREACSVPQSWEVEESMVRWDL